MIGFYKSLPSTRCCFDHLTIFFTQNTLRLPNSRNAFPINFYRNRVKKIQAYACTEKQKGNSKLREIASNRPLLLQAGFWCDMRVFTISYKDFMHVGMLQPR